MKDLWNKKAQNFPRFKKDDKETLEYLAFFNACGVDFSNQDILDIGCGNGRFALQLALSAKSVLAQDISSVMLESLMQDAKELGLENISICECDFKDFEFKKFPIVFASMTPALNNEAGILKAYNLAQNALCCIGWGRERKIPFLEEILAMHGIKLELPKGIPNYLQWLKNIDCKYKYFSSIHTYTAPLEKALKDVAWHIQIHNGIPNEKLIFDFVTKNAKDGILSYSYTKDTGALCVIK